MGNDLTNYWFIIFFEQQAVATPGASAIVFGNEQLTYASLNDRADLLSNLILKHSPDSFVVGISTTRSIEMVVGVLAILKSGKAYLPLDPAYQRKGFNKLFSDSGIDCCLSADAESSFFGSFGINALSFDKEHEQIETQRQK